MAQSQSPEAANAGQRQDAPNVPITFKILKDFRQAAVKLDNIDPLIAQSNYEDWADTMKMAFRGMGTSAIVIDGIEPAENTSIKERDAYTTLSQSALLILMQVLSKPILKKVSKYETPHSIWTYLHNTYYVNNTFSYIK